MLEDIKLDTVDFVPTYDEARTEPTVLPSKFPSLLINGSGLTDLVVNIVAVHSPDPNTGMQMVNVAQPSDGITQ